MDGQQFVGVDIGGTSTKIALVSEGGEISNLHRIMNRKVNLETEDFLATIQKTILDVIASTPMPVSGIGISTPGMQMKNGRGTMFSINMPKLNNVDLQEYFETETRLPVVVNNDLVAHSLAESRFGAGKDVERFLSVSLGTGIGHTFILNGVPQKILGGVSGDSGRMILDPASREFDSLGVFGTAEAVCGVKAIETLASQMFKDRKDILANEVISLAHDQHDPVAIEIMSIISRRLALLLINLASIYFPQVISVTGGQTEAGDFFIETCQVEFKERSNNFFDNLLAMVDDLGEVKIVNSSTGGLTGLLGSIVPLIKNIY